jgi:hypothetical protein
MKTSTLFFLVFALFFAGCSTFKPQKGGNAGSSLKADSTELNVNQSDSPAGKAEQNASRKESRETPTALPTAQTTTVTAPDGTVTETRTEFSSAVAKESIDQSTKAVVGPAQKDTARELAAKLAAMRPIQYAGIACLLFAAAGMFYAPLRVILGGGKQFPLAIGVLGAALIVAPQLIAGNETLILVGSAIAGFIYWLSLRLTRKEAEADLKK